MSLYDKVRKGFRLLSNPELLKDYIVYQYSRLRNDGIAIRQLYDGVQLTGFNRFSEYHSSRDYIGKSEYNFLTSFSFKAGPILDVEANLGAVSLILAHRFPSYPVHAFEPHPSTVKALHRNVALNDIGNISIHETAVGNKDSSILFDAHPQERATAKITEEENGYAVEVSCTTLDGWANRQNIESISLLKVDTEGYEMSVFKGAHNLLVNKKISTIYFEVCPSLARQAGFPAKKPAPFLENCGYSLYRISSHGSLNTAQSEEIESVSLENWVALR